MDGIKIIKKKFKKDFNIIFLDYENETHKEEL